MHVNEGGGFVERLGGEGGDWGASKSDATY